MYNDQICIFIYLTAYIFVSVIKTNFQGQPKKHIAIGGNQLEIKNSWLVWNETKKKSSA